MAESPAPPSREPDRRQTVPWALYDWGNSAFSTTIMSGFFPVFFKSYWSAGHDPTVSTFHLGIANSAASLVVALLAPVLGAIADRLGARKKFLLGFAFLGIAGSLALSLVAQGAWGTAAAVFVIALIGFYGSMPFYDSLLPSVAGRRIDAVSAFGYAMGYLGGGILFTFNILLFLTPESFGLAGKVAAVKVSFISVGVWWAIFTAPLLLKVPEPAPASVAPTGALTGLLRTLRRMRRDRNLFLFLIAYFLYIDGVDTIIKMAVDYGMALGLPDSGLVASLLIVQFVGFPAAIAFGRIGEKIGPRKGILIALAVYCVITAGGYFMSSIVEFYALAAAVALVMGGIQSLSRSLYARMIPPDRSAEYFGVYGIFGKFAAILGPFLMGATGRLTGNPRHGLLSILLLFAAGGALLARVRVRNRRPA